MIVEHPAPALVPGRNCRRVENATRVAVIIDAADYFEALREAMLAAERQILLVGWDFDTRVLIDRRDRPDSAPLTIGEYILWLADRRPDLCINILVWNLGLLSLARRGRNMIDALRWRWHPRIQLQTDSYHPLGGSVHHKLAVIDDRVAFCGGIDITTDRWDSPRHASPDPQRCNPDGKPYAPWHDVALAVEGPVAAALGDLARDRWQRAVGSVIDAPPMTSGTPWPPQLEADFRNVDVAIARTRPAFHDDDEIREIEQLFVDLIAGAERFIYVENQYFASRRIAEAIAMRLAEPSGPEIVVVNPATSSGWLAEAAMGSARATLLKVLGVTTGFERFRIYTPVAEDRTPIYVHAKLMIVDDRVLRIGSANFNNRSMALDGECDLALSVDENDRPSITALRERLLAEHLGCTAADVAQAFRASESLIGCIEALRGKARTLEPFVPEPISAFVQTVADLEILDPERVGDAFEPLAKRSLVRNLWRVRFRRPPQAGAGKA